MKHAIAVTVESFKFSPVAYELYQLWRARTTGSPTGLTAPQGTPIIFNILDAITPVNAKIVCLE
ncbi:MAG: hypothetical protein V2J65_36785 [Desulfobacteraceae bacterium]|jgi:hypothetical protein|nr:hypothetical protein [Desulfobacteraceae bacterium]